MQNRNQPLYYRIEELIEESIRAIHSKDIDKNELAIIKNIDGIVSLLRGTLPGGKSFDEYTANELSKINGSLAILKTSLGDILAKAYKNQKASELQLRVRKAKVRPVAIDNLTTQLGKKPTLDDINSQIQVGIAIEEGVVIFREYYYNRCLNMWRSVNTLLDAINTRIRVLMSDKQDVDLYDDMIEDFEKIIGAPDTEEIAEQTIITEEKIAEIEKMNEEYKPVG